jgi:glycosyltransferase involved in cell wall biosynthesis
MEEEAWKKGGYPRMAVEGQQWLDLSVVSSDYLKRWMVERGANPARTRVCYTNVDPDQWCPNEEQRVAIRQELAIDETVPILLYTGRICAQKQPRIFARVMLRLTQRAVPYAALVAGDGPDLGWLRTFIRKEGLRDRVHLLGVVTSARIRQLLAAADVFFLPSQWEGIALAIYEAMACGVPVVGADVGGQRELVTPECGRLIARGDEESEVEHYSEALVMLLANPSLRRRMGETSRRRVSEHFHLDQMGDRMAALLREAVCLHEAQPRSMPDFATGRAHAIRTVRYMQVCAILRRVTALPYLNRYKKWLFPFKETLERVLLR